MDMIPLKPERKAQLEEYAKRRGQDPAAALDDALATYLEWERHGHAPHVYRILFRIDEKAVYILHVRHGRRQPLKQ